MRLFSADLFRNFGFGFALAALLIVGVNTHYRNGGVASPAQAAEVLKAPAPTAEFVISPVEG